MRNILACNVPHQNMNCRQVDPTKKKDNLAVRLVDDGLLLGQNKIEYKCGTRPYLASYFDLDIMAIQNIFCGC